MNHVNYSKKGKKIRNVLSIFVIIPNEIENISSSTSS